MTAARWPEDVVERVARALHEEDRKDRPSRGPWEQEMEGSRELWRGYARAALDATAPAIAEIVVKPGSLLIFQTEMKLGPEERERLVERLRETISAVAPSARAVILEGGLGLRAVLAPDENWDRAIEEMVQRHHLFRTTDIRGTTFTLPGLQVGGMGTYHARWGASPREVHDDLRAWLTGKGYGWEPRERPAAEAPIKVSVRIQGGDEVPIKLWPGWTGEEAVHHILSNTERGEMIDRTWELRLNGVVLPRTIRIGSIATIVPGTVLTLELAAGVGA